MRNKLACMHNIKIFMIIVMINMTSYSGNAQWQLMMQEGGNIYSLIDSKNIMYAGTQFGVFKSIDKGATWNEANIGLTNTVINPMLSNESRIFAGTEAGIFISDNQGKSWIESNKGLTISKINCLLYSEEGIYAGTDDQGVYISSDNGENWSVLNNGLTNLSIKAIIKKDGRLFIGTDGAGVFYSDNEGEDWAQNNTGLSSWFINHLVVKDSKLYVSTNSNFYVSGNNGLSWSVLSTPFEHKILCSLNYQEYMFVGTDGDGIFYTTDEGSTWTDWSEGLENKNMYTIELFGDFVWSPSCCGYGLFKRLLPSTTSMEYFKSKNELNIYPNPATDIIHFKGNNVNEIKSTFLFDNSGKLLLRERFSGDLNISKFKAGIYFIQLQGKDSVQTFKIIKK